MLSPHQHQLKKFMHDHLGPHVPERAATEPASTSHPEDMDIHMVESPSRSPPRTPKIHVLAPPDEVSEADIQYIGVGLGTLSTEDKKPHRKSPVRGASEPNPTLHHRASSESMRSDTSATSGQLTPSEAMVYASPSIIHENIFENAFQRAEDKIRLSEGEHTMLYNTWRSEEMRGQPVTNEFGRAKVELERLDNDGQLRWERVLKEKLPERLADLHLRKEDRESHVKDTVGRFAEKMLGDRERNQIDTSQEKTQDQDQDTARSEDTHSANRE
jgi:hypothetical protein